MARMLTALATAVFALALICFPQAGAEAAWEGLTLCATVILPALFPYFVLTNLIIGQGLGDWLGRKLSRVMEPLFHVGGSGGAALALGLVGGYPVGAATVRALVEQGSCSREEGQRLLSFCNNAGPAFILSVAGGAVFGRMEIGFLLLGIHIASALGTGLLLRGKPLTAGRSGRGPSVPAPSGSALLTGAVQKALASSLQVSAYIVLFNLIIGLVRALFSGLSPLPVPLAALGIGLLELSNGVCALTGGGVSPLSLAACSFLLAWGGCSVHCQTAALLEGSGLRLAPYLGAKALQGMIAAGLALAISMAFPGLLSAAVPGISVDLTELFPLSVPLGWVLWAVVAFVLLKRGGNCGEEAV